jgi:hypothetical protein
MPFIVQKEFNAVAHLLSKYFKAPGPSIGTKADHAKNLARHFGSKEGIAESLAAILTEQRIAYYPFQEEYYEMVMSWDVEQALQPFRKEFPAVDTDDETRLLNNANQALHEIMLGDQSFRDGYALRRRKMIESGKLSNEFATAEDKAFWAKEAADAQHRSEMLHGLAGTPKSLAD